MKDRVTIGFLLSKALLQPFAYFFTLVVLAEPQSQRVQFQRVLRSRDRLIERYASGDLHNAPTLRHYFLPCGINTSKSMGVS